MEEFYKSLQSEEVDRIELRSKCYEWMENEMLDIVEDRYDVINVMSFAIYHRAITIVRQYIKLWK